MSCCTSVGRRGQPNCLGQFQGDAAFDIGGLDLARATGLTLTTGGIEQFLLPGTTRTLLNFCASSLTASATDIKPLEQRR